MALDTVKMNRFTLAFDDPGLEREFLDEYADSVRIQIRLVWSVGAGLTLAAALMAPPTRFGLISTVVQLGMIGPAIVLGVGATFLPKAQFRRFGPAASGVAGAIIQGLCPVILMAVDRLAPLWAHDSDPTTALSALVSSQVLIVMVGLVVQGRKFPIAATIATASVVAFLAALAAHRDHPGMLTFAEIDLGGALLVGMAAAYRLESFRRRLFLRQRQLAEEHEKLAAERAKSESLLLNVLPAGIADRLKRDPSHIADGFAEVTVLFADIVGFTDLSARLSPAEVVAMLNRLFTAFDDLAEKHGLEKIKTIGDAYMVVGGLPEARTDHAEAVIAMALGMRDAVAEVSKATGYDLKVRIGANSGPVVAGVIGKKKFAYDLWGDAVNTASRMESHGLPGEIQITASTQEKVKDAFELESRGTITVKGKGEMPAWFVRGRKAAAGTSPLASSP